MTAASGRDLVGNPVRVGDIVSRFKGGRYDRIDFGVVVSITGKGNLRLRLVGSSRRSDVVIGSTVLGDWTRCMLIVVPTEKREKWLTES